MNKRVIFSVIIVMATFVATSFAQSGEGATTEAESESEPEGEPTSSPHKDAGIYGTNASFFLICFGFTIAIFRHGF